MSERRDPGRRAIRVLAGALMVGTPLAGLLVPRPGDGWIGGDEMNDERRDMNLEAEKAELLEHVHRIFRAFLARDREQIERLHSRDWIGFLGPSTAIERGIGDYMVGADQSLDSFRGVSYEILESEVQISGDVGLVFYVATYTYDNGEEDGGTIPLRSVDVFRRRDGSWIQTGSHISVIPSGGRWGEGKSRRPGGE